jgi:hypothetical protein
MKSSGVRSWTDEAQCPNGHAVDVVFTLPDYGDAPALYQCRTSGDLFCVSLDAEHYIGPPWDTRRRSEECPTCRESLEYAISYPDNFRCPVCGELGRYEVDITRYPDESRSTVSNCWDPYES